MSAPGSLPRRIALKFFAEDVGSGAGGSLEPFIGLFHRFIQEQAVLGLLVDVADYAHVPEGPGVVLIGHDVDYAIDSTGGQTGLLTTRKHYAQDGLSMAELLRDTLSKAALAIRAIEDDGSTGMRFDLSRFEIQLLDRLAVSADGALEGLQQEISAGLAEVFKEPKVELATGDARRPATFVTRVPAEHAAALCDRLGVRMPERVRGGPCEIEVRALKQLRDAGSDFVLIDVREPDEYETCNLGGRLIPLGTLSERISELDKGAHVVVHCKGGGRGAKATATLRAAGFENAWNLKGGILAWIDEVDSSLTRY